MMMTTIKQWRTGSIITFHEGHCIVQPQTQKGVATYSSEEEEKKKQILITRDIITCYCYY